MPLSMELRLDRLKTRVAELPLWRIAESLPIENWTFDSEPIALGAPWPKIDGVFRFEGQAAAPEAWPLEETRLSIDVGGESLLTLNYSDGRAESFGIDPNHEEFPLLARNFAIATETVARKQFGQPVREPRFMRASLVRLEIGLDRLHLLLTQVAEAVQGLGADEAAAPMLEAAEDALRSLDWPSHTPEYLARGVSSRASQTVWRLPEVERPAPALGPSARASIVAAYEQLTARLRELKKRYPPRGKISLTGHAHIDLAWLWPYGETRRKLRRTFHTALGLIERSTDFYFNQSTAHYYWQLEQDDPDLLARIQEKTKAGQWEPLGAMWVEPDTNMPTGESLARQLLYGQRYFEKAFGARSNICWLPDCFGFSPALPQLLAQAGVDSFFTIKVNWSETNRFPHDLFWWEGLDGSKVLAHTFDNPLGGYNGRIAPDAYLPTWTNFRGKADHDETLLAVGYGDGGGGVTPEMIERQRQLEDFPALPSARWDTVKNFFARAHARARHRVLPHWSGEIYLELHRATLTTQSGVKRRHRQAERALIAAESAASIAHLLGGPVPENLEAIWRVVLKNEFHDILPGSSIAEVYQDAESELDGAIRDAKEIQARALTDLVAQAPRGEIEHAIAIVNPTLDARPITLTLNNGETISSEETIAPLSFKTIDRRQLAPAPGLQASARKLENKHLIVDIADDGSIKNLVHKATGREALADRGNQLWAYTQDKPRGWDAWDIDEDYEAKGEEILASDIALVEQSPHSAAIRVERRFRQSTLTQIYRLNANSARLDIETHIDWRDRRVLLRCLTPAAVRSQFASFECAHGFIQRPTHRNTSWEQAAFEAVAHRFIDLSEPGFGLALLNDAKYGHSVKDNVLGMSLVRSPIYPDLLADEGEQRFTYALYPHSGELMTGGVREEAEALNQPLLWREASGLAELEAQPLRIHGARAALSALSALKPAEDGAGLILRVYEPNGARGSLTIEPPAGWQVGGPLNLMEEPYVRQGAQDLMPFEVRTWRLTKQA